MLSTFSSDIELVIFDLDGTLVNTIADLGNSTDFALRSLGLPGRTIEEYTRFVGNGTLALVRRSLPDELKEDVELLEKAHAIFSEHYNKHYADNSAVYGGIYETVDFLKSQGIRLCVNTNKPDAFAKGLVQKLFKKDYFDIVFGARDGVPAKPDPTSENEIITVMGIDRSRVIHIGDSDVDVYTAKNAGIRCIACSWGFRSAQSLIDAGADIIANKPSDIISFLHN